MRLSINQKLIFSFSLLFVGITGFIIYQGMTVQTEHALSAANQQQMSQVELVNEQVQSLYRAATNTARQIAALQFVPGSATQTQTIDTILKNQSEISSIYLTTVPLVQQDNSQIQVVLQSQARSPDDVNFVGRVLPYLDLLSNNQPVLTAVDNTPVLLFPDWSYSSEQAMVVVAKLQMPKSLTRPEFNWLLFDFTLREVVLGNNPSMDTENPEVVRTLTEHLRLRDKTFTGNFQFEADNQKQLGSFLNRADGQQSLLVYQPQIQIISSIYESGQQMILAALMTMALGFMSLIWLSRRIAKPIEDLSEATTQVASGNFDVRIKHKTKDELGTLATRFEIMGQKIKKLLAEQAQKLRLENEVQIAATVQKTLFPENVVRRPQFNLYSLHQSATECGGDLWTYFQVNNKLVFMIADATGHGLSSALITVSAKNTFSMIKRLVEQEPWSLTPAAILAYANRGVYEVSQGKIQMTCFVGVLDLDTGALVYANAGHNPPWLFKQGRGQSLTSPATRLGELPEQTQFPEKSLSLAPGDKLFLYTDGLPEAVNQAGEQFGKKAVRTIVEHYLSKPEILPAAVMDRCKKFTGSQPLADDLTILLLELTALGGTHVA